MEYRVASLDHPSNETIAIAAHAIYRKPGRDAYSKLDMKATNTGRYRPGQLSTNNYYPPMKNAY